jgi:hypothetical protein
MDARSLARNRKTATTWFFQGIVVAVLYGCASTPNVTYTYYPARANSIVTVVQTIDCTSDQTQVVTLETATVNTVYFADYSKDPYTFPIKKVDGFFADSDVGLTFTDDGRLKSINQSSTGQCETIIKSAITLATAAAALGGAAAAPVAPLPQCQFLHNLGGGKPVTVSYSRTIDHRTDDTGARLALNPTSDSGRLYRALQSGLGRLMPILQVRVTKPANADDRANYDEQSAAWSDSVPLTLQRTSNVTIDILYTGAKISTNSAVVPDANTFTLPIPSSPWCKWSPLRSCQWW